MQKFKCCPHYIGSLVSSQVKLINLLVVQQMKASSRCQNAVGVSESAVQLMCLPVLNISVLGGIISSMITMTPFYREQVCLNDLQSVKMMQTGCHLSTEQKWNQQVFSTIKMVHGIFIKKRYKEKWENIEKVIQITHFNSVLLVDCSTC